MRMRSAGWVAHMEGEAEKERRAAEREAAYRAKQAARQEWLDEHTAEETCPKCGDTMYIMEGKYGKFLGCRNYPRCNGTREYGDPIICPKCGSEMVMRRGSKGRFYGCSNYPTCRGSLDIEEAKNHHKGVSAPVSNAKESQTKRHDTGTTQKSEKKPEPKPVYKTPSEEELNEIKYQYMVKCFSGNPRVDSEIAQYAQKMQSCINEIVRQYGQEYSKVSGRSDDRINITDSQREVTKKFYRSLQEKINEIDSYGRECIKKGMSEESGIMLSELIVGTVELSKQYNVYISYMDRVRCSSYWEDLKRLLPSELEGPDAKPIRKEICLQKDLIRIQKEQIAELKQKIASRDSVLRALKRESMQQNAKIDSCQRTIEQNLVSQNAELAPLDQQLEIVNGQIEKTTEKIAQLKQERKAQSFLAFKERRELREQIQECTTKINTLKAQVQRYEQHKVAITSKYSKHEEELQSAIRAAALKQQQAEDQICQLQKDIQDHISEKQLNARNLELEQMNKKVNELEDRVKDLRLKYMYGKSHLRMSVHYFQEWVES